MSLSSSIFKLTNLVRFGLGLLALLVIVPSTYAFTDLTSFHPHHDSIYYLQEKGILEGYEDGSFKPNQTINRAEFVKMVVASNGLEVPRCQVTNPELLFPDVELGKWYTPFICSARFHKIIDGYPDGTFKPGQPVNFVEAAKIISNGYQLNLSAETSTWYERYVKTLEGKKAIPGTVYAFNKPFTRSETSFSTHMLLEPKTASAKEAAGWTGNYQEIEKGGDRYVKVVNLKGDTLNVRKTNDPKSSEVGHLKEFDLVKAIDPPNGIIQKVQLLNGQIGYVHNTKFLKEGVEISEAAKQIEWFVEKEVGGHLVKKSSFQVASLNSDQKPPVKVVETIGPKRLYNTDIPPSNRCGNKIEWRFKDDQNRTVIFTYIEGHEGVHRVAPERVPLYELMGAPCSSAGAPISDYKLTGSHQSGDDSGYYQAFENARIYGFKGKDYMVSGAIFKEHENEGDDNARGTWSQYGFPTSDARKVGQKWIQDFEGGSIEVEAPQDFYYVAFEGWNWGDNELFGGVFNQPVYHKDNLIENLYASKNSNCSTSNYFSGHETMTVKVLGDAIDYNFGSSENRDNIGSMYKNYRTDRWYKIKYGNSFDKQGYVPVSSVVINDDSLFKVQSKGNNNTNCYMYSKIYSSSGYKTSSTDYIDKILLHNTVGSGVDFNRSVNYWLGRDHSRDINRDLVYKFASAVPEYVGSGTLNNDTLSERGDTIERKSITIEIVNGTSASNQDEDISNTNQYKLWNEKLNQSDFKGTTKFESFPQGQYDALNRLVIHMNKKYGILLQSPRFSEIPHYQHDHDEIHPDTGKKEKKTTNIVELFQSKYKDVYAYYYQVLKTERNAYLEFVNYIADDFSGIITHKHHTYYGKACLAPSFDIEKINSLNN